MTIRPLPHSIFVKREPKFLGSTIQLIGHNQFHQCLGQITAINPNSELAKEGYSVGQNIVFKQVLKGISVNHEDDKLLIKDDTVYGKYRYDKDGNVIIIPRKKYVFGECITKEKSGRIYLPEAIKNNKKEFYFKVISTPMDFNFKFQIFGGDILTFNPKNRTACKKAEVNGKELLFMPIQFLDAKLED